MERAPAQSNPHERGPVVLVTSPHAGHAIGEELLTRKLATVGVSLRRRSFRRTDRVFQSLYRDRRSLVE